MLIVQHQRSRLSMCTWRVRRDSIAQLILVLAHRDMLGERCTKLSL
jgi:hypothetical protein